jgi:hypothetical protein
MLFCILYTTDHIYKQRKKEHLHIKKRKTSLKKNLSRKSTNK